MVKFYATLILTTGAFIFTFSSCGPSKKMRAATAKIDSLTTANSDLINLKNTLEDSVKSKGEALLAAAQALQSSQTECETAKTDLAKTRNILIDEQGKMDALRNRLAEDLKEFLGADGEVKLENGKITIEMGNGLLYPTGSSTVNVNGRKGLAALSAVLNDYPDLSVNIVGGTDDKPFKGGADDNWSLSTKRANSVVRILSKKNNMDPTRLIASGKGEFNPVADNSTKEGRAKNRRTEILINANLNTVWSELN